MPEQAEADNLTHLPGPCEFGFADIVRLSSSQVEMTVMKIERLPGKRGVEPAVVVTCNWFHRDGDIFEDVFDARLLSMVRKAGQEKETVA